MDLEVVAVNVPFFLTCLGYNENLHKEDFSVQAKEFNSKTHYLLIRASFIL